VNPAAAGASRRDLTDAKGEVEMKSSNLKGVPKNSFTVTWLLSCGVEGVC
jgi:hypothetical protein